MKRNSKKFKTKRKLPNIITFFIIILGLVVIYFVFQGQEVKAEWFNESWMYRQRVDITNSGSAQTDFQVQITLDTATLISAGKMQSDCDDVRFTNINGKLLPYFQNTACNATKTRYWVKVNSIPTPSVTIYIYYGNPSVPAGSNRNETFDLSYLGTFSQIFSDANIASNHGASSDRENNFYISNSAFVNRFNTSWAYQQQYSSLDIYTGLCYDDKLDRFYGIDWSSKQWSAFTTSFVETSPLDQALGDEPIDCATDSTYVYTNHRTGLICRNRISDNNKECIDMDALSGFNWGGQGLTYTFGYLFAGTSASYGDNGNRIYMIDIDDWSDPKIVTSWDASGHTLAEVAGLTWKDKYIYQTSRSEDNANEWQGPLKVAATEPSVGSPTNEEQSPGPVAYWKFDEGYETTAYDSTQNANNGILTNGPTWKSEDLCMTGKCLYFDGADDEYVKTSSSVIVPDEATIAVWMRATAGNQIAENIYPFGFYQVSLLGSSGTSDTRSGLIAEKDSTNTYWDWGSQNLYDGKWHYYVVTWDATNVHLYIDAVEIGSPKAINSNIPTGESRTINAGTAWSNGGYGPHTGFMDEAKIYPYARSVEQIKADYLSGSAGAGGSASSVVLGGKPQKWLSDGLVGYWKMDENTGTTVYDTSGNGNNSITFSTPDWTGGKYGSALSFDDNNSDYIEIADSPSFDFGTGDFTYGAWVKTTKTTDDDYLISFNGSTDIYYRMQPMGEGRVFIRDSGGDDCYRDSISSLNDGEWRHFAFTWEGSTDTITIYIDGAVDQGSLYCDGTVDSLNAGSNLFIGQTGAGGSYYTGEIDEIRIYNRALSSKELRDLYNWAPGPVGYWKMDEGSWGTAMDSSGNGNNGIVYGGMVPGVGKFGKGGIFDGAGDYINAGNDASLDLDTFTVSSWIKTTGTGYKMWMARGAGQYWLSHHTSRLHFALTTSAGRTDLYATVNYYDNNWHHVVNTYDGAYMRMYMDGVEINSFAKTGTISGLTDLLIGRYNASYQFTGSVDDVRIYNYARTPKQIVEDMNAGHPVVGSPVGSQISYWKFNEGYGDTTNDSGFGGNNGNLAGACPGAATCPTWTNSGKFGKALSFDGIDEYVDSADPVNGQQEMSISVWVKPDPTDTTGPIAGNIYSWYYRYGIDISSGTYVARFRSTGGTFGLSSNTTYSGNWDHIVATYDNGLAKIFVNGILKNSGTFPYAPLGQQGDTFRIGTWSTGADNYFKGLIDEIKVYNFALTEDEVKLDYNRGASVLLGAISTNSSGNSDWSSSREYCVPGDTSTCNAPILNILFDDKNSSQGTDVSGNENHGTIIGAVDVKSAAQCNEGACVYLDGNDYYNIGNTLSVSTGMSLEMWFKADDIDNGSEYLMDGRNGGSWWWLQDYQSGVCTTQGNVCLESRCEIPGSYLSSNTWYHVVATEDSSECKIYLNGQLINTGTGEVPSIGASMRIGARYTGSGAFVGYFDGAKIYDYVRTPAQVAWSYNRGGPVGWWKFDECQATITYDSSGNGNNGAITIGGTGSQDGVGTCVDIDTTKAWYNGRNGKYNYSLNFDGVDDYVDVTSGTLSNTQGTVGMWYYNDTTYSDQDVLFGPKCSGCNYPIHIAEINGSNGFRIYNETAWKFSVSNLSSGWHHVVVLWYDTTLELFVDGISRGTASYDSSWTSIGGVYIGADSVGSRSATGKIDDVRIYNYALTEEQIKNVMNQGAAIRFGPSEGSP